MAWNANRPYCVIDDGWQTKKKAEWASGAPRDEFQSAKFTSMQELLRG